MILYLIHFYFFTLLGQSERENKLFIGMLPKTVDEEGLEVIFSSYGDLREVHIIRGPDGSSKGCAFVKFEDRNAALVAIVDLHDSMPMGSNRPLVVKFADTKKNNSSEEANIIQSVNNINPLQLGHNSLFQNNQFKDYDSYGNAVQYKAPIVHGLQNKTQKLQYPPSQQTSNADYEVDSNNLYGNSHYLQQSSMLYKENEIQLELPIAMTKLKPHAAQFKPRNQIPQNISFLPEDLPEDSRVFQQQLYNDDVYLHNNNDRYSRQQHPQHQGKI